MTTKTIPPFAASLVLSDGVPIIDLSVVAMGNVTTPMTSADARDLAEQLVRAADEADRAFRVIRRRTPAGAPQFEEAI